MKRMFVWIAIAMLALPVRAGASDPAWLQKIVDQLKIEQYCEVVFFVRMREHELGGRRVEEARAQCLDGRQFDATRTEPETDFTIRLCGVEVC